MNNSVIYVKCIPTSFNQKAVESLFTSYGKISKIILPVDKKTNLIKGYAFVTFEDSQSAQNALEKNGVAIENDNLIVEIAKNESTKVVRNKPHKYSRKAKK